MAKKKKKKGAMPYEYMEKGKKKFKKKAKGVPFGY